MSAKASEGAKPRLLVVEDDQGFGELLLDEIEDMGLWLLALSLGLYTFSYFLTTNNQPLSLENCSK